MPTVDVRLVQVTKAFGDVFAVDHIDLEVHDGEFFSLLGPSGCGKTTTLRMIGGFEQPTSGMIELQGTGRDVAAAVQAARQHGLPELRAVPAPDDLRERRLRAAARAGSRTPRSSKRVTDMLELVELPGFERRKPGQISGGQAQRVALARALINRPAVLLLDEPLGALDLKLRKQMQVELKRIQHEVGITFIYVTHDQEEAMTMSDRIAVMNRGSTSSWATPRRSTSGRRRGSSPGSSASATCSAGKCEGADGGFGTIRLGDGSTVQARRGRSSTAATTSTWACAPRRSASTRKATRRADGHNHLTGTVVDASYIGVSTQYIVETRAGPRVMVYEQNIERTTREELWAPRGRGPPHLVAGPHVRGGDGGFTGRSSQRVRST